MKHKEYTTLMKTPFEKLSKKDQAKRTKEFKRRLSLAGTFMKGISEGHVNEDFIDLIPTDDPVRDVVEILKIKLNDNLGAEA